MTRPRRFLFVMHYPGYLRYFDSAIRLLVERGHHVDLVFDNPEKQAEGTAALDSLRDLPGSVENLGRIPRRDDRWVVVTQAVRGTMDYVRYLHPSFADTPYLRDRMRSALPPIFSIFSGWKTASVGTTQRLIEILARCERAIPSSGIVESFISSRRPDAVLVTPLVVDRSPQTDVIKSAQALGIPAALCVASWDHLTTKGLMRVQPDLVAVWNDEQRKEAIEYHSADPERIVVTGAQPFDRWFERTPTERGAFCGKVGLPRDRPFVLFVGSTASISAPETELRFVRRWIQTLRQQPGLAHIGVLVRPHPYNSTHWRDVSFDDLANVSIYPRSANPVNEADRQDYFDSLYHSEAVVGVNTTAMIEAAIVGRTVHTVLADEFRDTQEGTLHFRYLLSENGGFLRVAGSLVEHARQIAETVQRPDIGRAACLRFVSTFIRPAGVDVQTTPILVDALERLASAGRLAPARVPGALMPLQLFLLLGGRIAIYSDPRRLVGAIRKSFVIKGKQIRRWWRYSVRKRPVKRRPVPPDPPQTVARQGGVAK